MQKSLALLSLVVFAVACGGSSSGKHSNKFERYTDKLSTLARGTTILEHRSGQTYLLSDGVASVAEDVSLTESIVLKVEGNKYYALESQTEGGVTSRSVRLTKLITPADLQTPGTSGTMNGDVLSFNFSQESTDWTIKSQIQIHGQINLANPYCDVKYESVSTNAWYLKNGVRTTLPDVAQETETTCARTLSSAELKALDLKSVQFCDDTSDADTTCESNKDMSFLTADL